MEEVNLFFGSVVENMEERDFSILVNETLLISLQDTLINL